MKTPRWLEFATALDLQKRVADRLITLANECIANRGQFHLVLAGGETPRGLYQRLSQAVTDWSKWQIYFGDERCLPEGHHHRNDIMACSAWLDYIDIPPGNIHEIPAHLPTQECLEQYAAILRDIPCFDLVLLGLGEDGHTASLFPGHDLGQQSDVSVLAISDAPKPPSQRISLSASRLSAAHRVWFLVSGPGKQEALHRWQQGALLPAAAIQPRNGVDVYFSHQS